MILDTKYFGQLEIDKRRILTFPEGIPAFEDYKEYVLIDLPDNDAFQCLQSTQQQEVAFLLIKPWDFFPDYDIRIPQEELDELEITRKEQVAVYNIVTIPSDTSKITANLMGPIIINMDTLKGKQIILHQEDYHTKHLLIRDREEG